MKHTPGPWTIDQLCDKDNFIGIIGIKNCQATVDCDTPPPIDINTDEENRWYDKEQEKFFDIANANIKLIAAAPEMLQALEGLTTEFRYAMQELDRHDMAWNSYQLEKAEQAIKKATE